MRKKPTIAVATAVLLAGGVAAAGVSAAWADSSAPQSGVTVSLTTETSAGVADLKKVQQSRVDAQGDWKSFDYYTSDPDQHSPTFSGHLTEGESTTLQQLATSDAFTAEGAHPVVESCRKGEETVDYTLTAGKVTAKLSGCWPTQRPAEVRLPDTAAAKMIRLLTQAYDRH